MSTRTLLKPFSVCPGNNSNNLISNQMSNNINGIPTSIYQIPFIGYSLSWTGTPTGSFGVQVSNDYALNAVGGVQNSGTWTALLLSAAVSAAGSASNGFIDIDGTSAAWIRPTWTSTATGAQTIQPIADVSGSLASAYFLIPDALGHKYAIWFKVSGVGSAPSVAGYTNVEQDISNNNSAATIGAALATTISGLNSSNSFTASGTTTVTVTNKTSGPFVLASDGVSPNSTGFTFAGTTGSGLLTAIVAGKTL